MNILFFGPSASLGTGYGLLIRNIGKRFKKAGHNVYQLGLHTVGEIDERYGFPILPVGDDPHGADRLLYYVTQYNIDILITVTDLFPDHFNFVKGVVKQTGIYWIHHCTIYSTPLSPFRAKVLTHTDLIIAPSKFAYHTIKNAKYDNVKYIPHGVDLDVFKPMPEQREKDRKEMKVEDKFIFLMVARNVPLQKDYPTLFHAYKTFLTNVEGAKEKTLLHCHTNPTEFTGFNLSLMAKRFGIMKNVTFTAGHNANFTLPPERMAEIYNYADVNLCLSTGESFHLPTIEGFACGKPCIAMNFSAPVEHIKNSGAGLLSDIKGMMTTKLISDLCINDEFSFAKHMGKLYEDKELREEMGKKGIEYAKNFEWDSKILPQWMELLK